MQGVAGIEARGFILGGAIAEKLGCGFVPIRKKGKLPWKTIGQEYTLEYGADIIEMHQDAIDKGERILIVDDLIATGGTAEAAAKLVRRSGGEIVGACFIIDLPDLGGTKKLAALGIKIHALMAFEGHCGEAYHAARRCPAARRSATHLSLAQRPGAAGRLSGVRPGGPRHHRPVGAALCGVVCARVHGVRS